MTCPHVVSTERAGAARPVMGETPRFEVEGARGRGSFLRTRTWWAARWGRPGVGGVRDAGVRGSRGVCRTEGVWLGACGPALCSFLRCQRLAPTCAVAVVEMSDTGTADLVVSTAKIIRSTYGIRSSFRRGRTCGKPEIVRPFLSPCRRKSRAPRESPENGPPLLLEGTPARRWCTRNFGTRDPTNRRKPHIPTRETNQTIILKER